ncbi:hypothetical protein EJ02DRAFT_49282 [Clathrospora elynae]|uniref:Uncharacterized protein n=1 Tax=Clathrospora elynae TaxID=706981 RepID=A0A6A5SDU3_9PLEO|nr:hypothetical protein EJ02DRAFT_49282 [Clathrospora elynae]
MSHQILVLRVGGMRRRARSTQCLSLGFFKTILGLKGRVRSPPLSPTLPLTNAPSHQRSLSPTLPLTNAPSHQRSISPSFPFSNAPLPHNNTL